MYQVWKRKADLSGKEQRDAQEFLMALFDLLHGDTEALTPPPPTTPCPCLVHTIFQGSLRSQVACDQCGQVSVTEEAFLDLGLDVPKKPTGQSLHCTQLSHRFLLTS